MEERRQAQLRFEQEAAELKSKGVPSSDAAPDVGPVEQAPGSSAIGLVPQRKRALSFTLPEEKEEEYDKFDAGVPQTEDDVVPKPAGLQRSSSLMTREGTSTGKKKVAQSAFVFVYMHRARSASSDTHHHNCL